MSHRRFAHRRRWELLQGDSLEVLKGLPDGSIDAMITDPPAGISFMGKEWDSDKGGRDAWVAWLSQVMQECCRVLKPGAHILVWALPRTSHWTATAIENAGFEIRDRVQHLFGSGFPKSLNLGNGLGTALKPAAEDWWLARKPLAATVAANILRYSTGALNIDGCRIGTEELTTWVAKMGASSKFGQVPIVDAATCPTTQHTGRWPAHLILSHSERCIKAHKHVTEARPEGAFSFKGSKNGGYEVVADEDIWVCQSDCPVRLLDEQSTQEGGASRFFYVPKPDRSERDLGCDFMEMKTGGELTNRKEGSAGLKNPRAGAGRTSGGRNLHPTTKSIELMRWLCRLITPPGGVVLDPFVGSGSTGCGAIQEGFRFIGVELSHEYAEIARARISFVAKNTKSCG